MSNFIPEYKRLNKQPQKIDISLPKNNNENKARIFTAENSDDMVDGVNIAKLNYDTKSYIDIDIDNDPVSDDNIEFSLDNHSNDSQNVYEDDVKTYILMLNDILLFSSDDKYDMENYIESLLYNENSEHKDIKIENLTLLKKIEIKAGIFINDR